jgi:hypothetical protein
MVKTNIDYLRDLVEDDEALEFIDAIEKEMEALNERIDDVKDDLDKCEADNESLRDQLDNKRSDNEINCGIDTLYWQADMGCYPVTEVMNALEEAFTKYSPAEIVNKLK